MSITSNNLYTSTIECKATICVTLGDMNFEAGVRVRHKRIPGYCGTIKNIEMPMKMDGPDDVHATVQWDGTDVLTTYRITDLAPITNTPVKSDNPNTTFKRRHERLD